MFVAVIATSVRSAVRRLAVVGMLPASSRPSFSLLDNEEREALVATLGGGIPRCRVIGPINGDPAGWALADMDSVVDSLL